MTYLEETFNLKHASPEALDEFMDIWKSPPVQTAYQPADDATKQFFRQVRELAPKERLTRVIALPFSPLR